jgi:hypothetical protein
VCDSAFRPHSSHRVFAQFLLVENLSYLLRESLLSRYPHYAHNRALVLLWCRLVLAFHAFYCILVQWAQLLTLCVYITMQLGALNCKRDKPD